MSSTPLLRRRFIGPAILGVLVVVTIAMAISLPDGALARLWPIVFIGSAGVIAKSGIAERWWNRYVRRR